MSNPIDFTKPVQTFAGEPVEIVTSNGRGQYPVLGYIGDRKAISSWTSKGLKMSNGPHPDDLMNIPTPRVGYVNVYRDGSASIYPTTEAATNFADTECIARIKIEWKEGQYDE